MELTNSSSNSENYKDNTNVHVLPAFLLYVQLLHEIPLLREPISTAIPNLY